MIYHPAPEIVFTFLALLLFVLTLVRFIYECDFALDFGFYDANFRPAHVECRSTKLIKEQEDRIPFARRKKIDSRVNI